MTQKDVSTELLEFIRQETFNEKKAEFVHECFNEFLEKERIVELVQEMDEIYQMIEVAVLAWNVCDQIKKRKNGILALREPVFEWVESVMEKLKITNRASVIERIGYSVSLGRLNYMKRHSELKTMRDLIRIADIQTEPLKVSYDDINKKIVDCFNEITWFYQETDSIERKILMKIMLEQCPLCWIDSVEKDKLKEVVSFLVMVWTKVKPPMENDIGEALFNLSESITDDFDEQTKITGIVLNFIQTNNIICKIVSKKEYAIGLLKEALELLRNQQKTQ
ncbi:hypothetical protein ENUP19_0113G0010 [Entamoeba nuttalli]|uniref:Uncharacterized protein n=2 Tax=Entamoeba nuttalli TaxID=412467 RepID=K2GVR9_ENTNP|nr:hypothetical protein ENU1_138190 [Entamoeba nuttalli P19]EKE39188.1 hypothetical protein ENU1_138190 [Entamoeba nuttalli P19]|eukprot:XP_008858478.1 hypothetical protein ENU1_138190 [Entamoeba nuttalli P19]